MLIDHSVRPAKTDHGKVASADRAREGAASEFEKLNFLERFRELRGLLHLIPMILWIWRLRRQAGFSEQN